LLVFLLSVSVVYSQNSEIQTIGVWSASLERVIDVTVYTPPGYSYTAAEPYRVYIFLHGGFGSVEWDYAKFMQPILDDLISNEEIDPIVVVFPVLKFQTVHGKEIIGDVHFFTDSERNGKYSTVITTDILEWLPVWYNVTSDRRERAIGGFSMGGDGALRIAIRNSDKFIAAVSHDGTPSIHFWLTWKQLLLDETPGPPYSYNIDNGIYSAVWFGLSAAFSPNMINPNVPEMYVDFPLDSLGNIIDSVFYDQWVVNHNVADLWNNPMVHQNNVDIYFDASDGARLENDMFKAELDSLEIPYTFKSVEGGHGIYNETIEAGLRFIDAEMDAALTRVDERIISEPQDYQLNDNYPNPFNPCTLIRFELPEASDVRLEIFNIQGQLVTTLSDRWHDAGSHQVRWDANDLAGGLYIYRITATNAENEVYMMSRKMMYLK
jgi:S-formylglutathione hydrolase FrmB